MRVKVGILGFGFMGHEDEKMLSTLKDDMDLVAICDIVEDQMDNATTPSIHKYTDMDEFFKDEDMNTVIIAIPNHLHKDAVIKAANAGKHIICEKPVAMTVAELDEMIEVVNQCGVKFTVHHQRRYDPDFRTAKNVYDQKKLGKVFKVQSSLYGINGNMHDWHVFKKYGGGMLYDWGVHLIDQILWMVDGKITSVYADLRNVINEEVDDYFKIIMKFDNAVTAEIELGTYILADKPKWFERHWFIGGDKGSLYLDGFDPAGKISYASRLLENVDGKRIMTAAGPTRSFGTPAPGVLVTEDVEKATTEHVTYFHNFMKAMNGEEEFLVKVPEVRRVLALMEAIRESAKTGEAICFEK